MSMFKLLNSVLFSAVATLTFLSSGANTYGFALLGNFAGYQTQALGYNRAYGADLGGPMNIGDEYRWNVPTIVYGFDASFADFFGSRGILEVGKAFQVYNNLPPFSKMSPGLTEYPLDTTRENYRAQALGLIDLKSFTLAALTEPLGLTEAERFVWTLYSRVGVAPNIFQYVTISRNFDPVTLQQTNAVNGAHYGYVIDEYVNPNYTDADEYQKADPDVIGFNSVSSGFLSALFRPGTFFTGLTRDDVGGLRYIYTARNFNVEGINTGTTFLLSGASATSTATPQVNNVTFISSPYNSVFGSSTTNLVTTNAPAAGTNGTGVFLTTPPVNLSLRGGVDKLTFIPGKYDSLLGFSFISMTNTYTDRFVSNSVQFAQVVSRVITTPDMVFTAEDLGNVGGIPVVFARGLTITSFGRNNTSVGANRAGPGVMSGTYVGRFTSMYPILINQTGIGVDDTAGLALRTWATFDGSDPNPIIYPNGASISDLEQHVLVP